MEIPAVGREFFEDAELHAYLTRCVVWAAMQFGRSAPEAAVRIGWGTGPETVFTAEGPIVFFQRGSNAHQVRHQAAHEAFHLIWGRPVFHWTHELAAQWSAMQLDLGRDVRYAFDSLAASVVGAAASTMGDVRAYQWQPQPGGGGLWPPASLYHRLTLTGMRLVSAVGVGALVQLVTEVAEAADADLAADGWIGGHAEARELLGG